MVEIIKKMKVGICGHFGDGHDFFDGQTIKTRITMDFLVEKYGKDSICKVDTYGGKKKVLKHIFGVTKLLKKCQNIIILPAYNGLRVFAPLLVLLNKIYKRRLHYIVIGGWLPQYLEEHELIKECLLHFNYIYVETNTMKNKLQDLGFSNVIILTNYKKLKRVVFADLNKNYSSPYNLCILSRITPKKGIEDAIFAVHNINNKNKNIKYKLDIYGQIDSNYKDKFMKLVEENKPYVKYLGIVPYDKTVDIIKNYYLLLFPTKFYTEGIPGTIIDAYASGVPVVSSRWQSFHDLIIERETGIGYEFDDKNALEMLLDNIWKNPNTILNMKKQCLVESEKYKPENALIPLINRL